VLLALTITMAVQVVGTLLLVALVVTPAATALRLTARPGRVAAIAVVVALLSVWVGLVLSAVIDLPPSFFIVSVAVLQWLGARASSASGRIAVRTPLPPGDHAQHAPR
jgi:zinc/manganese transport system permease protein